jgi:hypothetical protein
VLTVAPKKETLGEGDAIPRPFGKGIITVVNPELANALLPILVTELGIVTVVKKEQSSNASIPIVITELGIVTLVNEEQLSNARSPIVSTLLPIVRVVNAEQP